ncbi:MAG: 1-acyl-sn-glycerol-3-phosphate acyltransferase [Chitinophagales bacterium]|nr:1-acyl-sn-glycerol-3-phosphate acyltransferase [Chitinophagales bacterium]
MNYRNRPLHPILRILYFGFRLLTWAGVSVFYRRRLVLGREHLALDGPAIVVSNHPSTLMDVLNVGLEVRQELFFLANYGLFRHPLSNWLLRKLYCIPVMRQEDLREGEQRDNNKAFEESFRHLELGGLLFIAAEGVSWMERRVRPFKTGSARIAFGTELRNAWQADVKILPVGLSYSAPDRFRSEVVIQFGEPVLAAAWREAFEANADQAIQELTEQLQARVSALTIDSKSAAGESCLGILEAVAQNTQTLPQDLKFRRSQALTAIAEKQELAELCSRYSAGLAAQKISDGILAARRPTVQEHLFLFFGAPFFLLGYAWWFLPSQVLELLARRLNLYIGYDATLKILGGLFTWGAALWGTYALGRSLGLGPQVAIVFPIMALGLGAFADLYRQRWQRWTDWKQYQRSGSALKTLADMRAQVLTHIRKSGIDV